MTPDEKVLVQLLKKEQNAFLQFETLLDEESKALVSASPDELLEVVDKKSAAAEELHQLASERDVLMKQLGINADDIKQVAEWFNQRPPKDELALQWNRLLEVGRSVVKRNASNGKLIHQRLESTQTALNILQKAAGTPELYGRDGKIKTPFSTGY